MQTPLSIDFRKPHYLTAALLTRLNTVVSHMRSVWKVSIIIILFQYSQ